MTSVKVSNPIGEKSSLSMAPIGVQISPELPGQDVEMPICSEGVHSAKGHLLPCIYENFMDDSGGTAGDGRSIDCLVSGFRKLVFHDEKRRLLYAKRFQMEWNT